MNNLGNLIFLDLYNNCITELTAELRLVRTLRVLMLGKNRISRITHLDKLNKLDVLDLHSNNIRVMENLAPLTELRVLNLAGNAIKTVENIGNLQSLTELNLRRNKISQVYELHLLPALQRVFLSNNELDRFEDASCVFKIKFLLELALDGNPVVSNIEEQYVQSGDIVIKDEENSTPSAEEREKVKNGAMVVQSSNLYRAYVIENIKTLRHFDLKRVGDEERRQAAVLRKRLEEKKRLKTKKNNEGENRKKAIKAAERAWAAKNSEQSATAEGEEEKKNSADPFSEPALPQDNNNGNGEEHVRSRVSSATESLGEQEEESFRSSLTTDSPSRFRSEPAIDGGEEQSALAQSSYEGGSGPRQGFRVLYSSLNTKDRAKQGVQVTDSWKGYYEIEVPIKGASDAESKTLHLYGDGFDCLNDSTKIVSDCNEVVIRYLNVEAIADKAPALFEKTSLRRLILSHNAVKTFAQIKKLTAFTESEESVDEICILGEGNPVASLQLFRFFCAYALPGLRVLDGEEITQSERGRGHLFFAPLYRASGAGGVKSPAALLKTGGMGVSLYFPDKNGEETGGEKQQREIMKIARGVEEFVKGCREIALETEKLSMEFEACWPKLISNIVDDSIKDVNDEGSFLSECLDRL